jgi:biofilm PGA synthesis lipoprotein PgaB
MQTQRHIGRDFLMAANIRAHLPVQVLIACALMLSSAVGAATDATLPVKLTILGYHEISERTDSLEPGYSVPPEEFAQEMAWLKSSGYHFVSMDDVLADAHGRKALPDKAVLLTFDDGYQSVYKNAFPILKAYHAPAVVALVGGWLESAHGIVDFDGRPIPRSDLMSWAELREMTQSGLVEIASHTHSLHQGIIGNPEGNKQPAAVTRQWLAAQGRYEAEAAYKSRIKEDLKRNSEMIRAHLGLRPRVVVWPYGRYNIETRSIAARLSA